ncbi:MAG: RdgB/HAM1 family non-canonical purine NTP pyrophosphatase [Verrucomicrobia bacterium]|nr:RdgB/HAM1 family non-canonical purine NTP pyrophosphatase [Verrucomicrobiota bacterium]
MKLIIASKNVHKIREFRSMLRGNSKIDLYSLIDFPDYELPAEEGSSFEENAIIKAVDAAKILDEWVFADDSGLVIPALDGAPGILSARFAGEKATDKENRKKLLNTMRDLKEEQRQGYYECCIALASPEGLVKTASARCEGTIIEKERGGQGFGYDSLFKKHDYNKTFAELEEEVKNRISHRRKALDKILLHLESSVFSH